MNKKLAPQSHWRTSSFGSPADTSPLELAALGEHLSRCVEQRRGLLSGLQCMRDALNDFAAARVMTILALFAALALTASLLT